MRALRRHPHQPIPGQRPTVSVHAETTHVNARTAERTDGCELFHDEKKKIKKIALPVILVFTQVQYRCSSTLKTKDTSYLFSYWLEHGPLGFLLSLYRFPRYRNRTLLLPALLVSTLKSPIEICMYNIAALSGIYGQNTILHIPYSIVYWQTYGLDTNIACNKLLSKRLRVNLLPEKLLYVANETRVTRFYRLLIFLGTMSGMHEISKRV